MIIRSGNLGSLVLMVLLVFCLLLMAHESWAQDDGLSANDGKVEVIYSAESSTPYKERRSTWSTLWGLNLSQVLPDKYRSQVNSEAYGDIFGDDPIQLVQLEAGIKYNFALGSVGLSVLGGGGSVKKDGAGGRNELSVFKKSASLFYILDSLFPEPYFAPYVQSQVYSFDWKEVRNESTEVAGTTQMGMATTFGALVQLNWLDSDTALKTMNTFGLQNTYLDFFVSQHNTSNSEEDPDFQTELSYGAGLRLEF